MYAGVARQRWVLQLGADRAHRRPLGGAGPASGVDPSIPPIRVDVAGAGREIITGAGLTVPVTMHLRDLPAVDVVVVPALGTMTAEDTLTVLVKCDRGEVCCHQQVETKSASARWRNSSRCCGRPSLATSMSPSRVSASRNRPPVKRSLGRAASHPRSEHPFGVAGAAGAHDQITRQNDACWRDFRSGRRKVIAAPGAVLCGLRRSQRPCFMAGLGRSGGAVR